MRYEKYKETDQLWMSFIPQHWNYWRAKRLFDSPKVKNIDNKEDNVLSLTLRGVIRNSKDNPIGLSPSDYATYQIFEKNDLVFKLIDLENISTSRVGIVTEHGIMSSAYIRFTARENINIRYFYYQYHDWWLRQIFNGLGAGVRQTLSAQDLLNLKLAVPPREEQDQIVRYLDWKVSAINKLIHGYQKQIKLLEEKKRSFTFNAATKGLDVNAAKRVSDIYWLNDIPAHWTTKSVAQLFTEVKCKNIGMVEKNLLSLSYGHIKKRNIDATEGLLPDNFEGYNIIEKDDIVLRLTDLQNDHRSLRTGISKERGIITSAYVTIRNKSNNNPEYLQLYMHSFDLAKGFYNVGASGVRQSLNWDAIKSLKVLVPPIEEQIEIVKAIKNEYENTQLAINSTQKEINLLQEYRTRLISDVVTGQIDVRNVTIPEYEVETAEIESNDEEGDLDE